LIDLFAPLGRVVVETLQRCAPASRLSPAQYRLLSHLADCDRLSSEMARILAVTPSSVTTLADILVERGLVERVTSPADRRCVRLRLTPAGMVCLELAQASLIAALSRVAARLPEEEQRQLNSGLRALRDAIEAR
jgi:MarR family transcriptional regulator, lower aerobic nicotinate degradation pathway regulator